MRDRLSRTLTLLIAVFLVACNNAAIDANGTPTPIPTSIVPAKPVYEVQFGDIVKEVAFFGRIAPITEAELFFRTGGYVKHVYVANGDNVTAGQVIAELENLADLERQNDLNQLQVRLAELDLFDAELALTGFEVSLPDPAILSENATQAVIEAEMAVIEFQAAVDTATANQTTNGLALELAQSRLAEAQITLNNARGELERLEVSPYPLGLEEAWLVMKNAVERAQIILDQVNLTDADLANSIAAAQIVAPFDGKILFLGLSEGRPVEAFQRVIVVGDTTQLEVRAELSGNDLVGLTEGMTVLVSIFNAPGVPVEGTIWQLPSFANVGNGSDNEANLFTRIALNTPPAESGFELNDRVRITVVLESREDVLWLPPQAVRSFEGRNFVVVQEDDSQRRIDVRLGLVTGDRVEVLLVEGVENLSEGQLVIGP